MGAYINDNEKKFLKSVLAIDGIDNSVDFILNWLQDKKNEVKFEIQQVPIDKLNQWCFDEEKGIIKHESGKFFNIEGVHIETNYGLKQSWDQPIINQPEIGYLGILTKEINGILHFLLQAKIEPGNINVVQLSPTLQATKSNYTKVHKGKSPLYLEYFNGEKKVDVLIDQLQSEQGARFLRKRNRNIVIQVGEHEEVPIYENFIWVTLSQLKKLLTFDNVVNMDTRTVISSISYGAYSSIDAFKIILREQGLNINNGCDYLVSMLKNEDSLLSLEQIISWITKLKSKYELFENRVNLRSIDGWNFDGSTIIHNEGKYFSVIGVNIQIFNREVVSWDQPMIKPLQEGLIGFVVKKINGVYHFLLQAKVEPGNLDILELAPTVQCLTGNYRKGFNEYTIPYISDILEATEGRIIHKSYQSEEGGRFFQEQNLNIIVEAKDDFSLDVPDNYCWLTLNQILTFMKFNNYLNIATRSLISLIPFERYGSN